MGKGAVEADEEEEEEQATAAVIEEVERSRL